MMIDTKFADIRGKYRTRFFILFDGLKVLKDNTGLVLSVFGRKTNLSYYESTNMLNYLINKELVSFDMVKYGKGETKNYNLTTKGIDCLNNLESGLKVLE